MIRIVLRIVQQARKIPGETKILRKEVAHVIQTGATIRRCGNVFPLVAEHQSGQERARFRWLTSHGLVSETGIQEVH